MNEFIRMGLDVIPKADRLSWINQLKHNRMNSTHDEDKREISQTIIEVCHYWGMDHCT